MHGDVQNVQHLDLQDPAFEVETAAGHATKPSTTAGTTQRTTAASGGATAPRPTAAWNGWGGASSGSSRAQQGADMKHQRILFALHAAVRMAVAWASGALCGAWRCAPGTQIGVCCICCSACHVLHPSRPSPCLQLIALGVFHLVPVLPISSCSLRCYW